MINIIGIEWNFVFFKAKKKTLFSKFFSFLFKSLCSVLKFSFRFLLLPAQKNLILLFCYFPGSKTFRLSFFFLLLFSPVHTIFIFRSSFFLRFRISFFLLSFLFRYLFSCLGNLFGFFFCSFVHQKMLPAIFREKERRKFLKNKIDV